MGRVPKGIHEPHGIATGGIIPRGEAQLLTYGIKRFVL